MAQTTNFGFEKPDATRKINEEFPVLGSTLDTIDAALKAILDNANSRAPAVHSQAISTIVGLTDALASKMPANAIISLDTLSDVSGAAAAANGYVLVKSATGWVPSSAAAAIGNHQHQQGDIVGLPAALAARPDRDEVADALVEKADAADTAAALATKADAADTIAALAGKADAATTTAALASKATILGDGSVTTTTLATTAVITGINSSARKIECQFKGLQTVSSATPILIQLGVAGALVTSGYSGSASRAVSGVSGIQPTNGAGLFTNAATEIVNGTVVADQIDAATNEWNISVEGRSAVGGVVFSGGATVTLAGPPDRIAFLAGSGNLVSGGKINMRQFT